jgi:hypothetical protein
MGIKLNRGDGEADMCIVRTHPHCHLMTDWWWGGGCITVCAACGGQEEVTDASMRKLCKEAGWGPIPPKSENTNLPPYSERPRLVGKMSAKRKRADDDSITIVNFTCPSCKYTHVLTFGGWTAIACPCGVDLARNKRSL